MEHGARGSLVDDTTLATLCGTRSQHPQPQPATSTSDLKQPQACLLFVVLSFYRIFVASFSAHTEFNYSSFFSSHLLIIISILSI